MAARKKRAKKKAVKRNPRRSLKKDHLWIVFKLYVNAVEFVDAQRKAWSDKAKAIRFTTKKQAEDFATTMYSTSRARYGVAPDNMSASEILRDARGKR